MFKKLLYITSIILLLQTNFASAGMENEELKKSKSRAATSECFEGFSRVMFKFNQGLDGAIFEPVAKGYRKFPIPIRRGTSNVLSNLSNLMTIPNNLLQGEIKQAGQNTIRFVVNTTLGILGIFDPASGLGFASLEKEDYGQTFGKWGVGPGCYVVLPVLGPSTVRDTFGSFVNVIGGDPWYNASANGNNHYLSDSDYVITKVLGGIDFRAKNLESLDNLEKNSMDFYASIRSLYLQDRQQKISNSNTVTDTQDDGDWEEIEAQ
jgi:phospholipid-binding lipoprotein MlaA